ncbi:MAG TPA: DcrB-related protein [Minicystis sp.]|nr:DcrB-related protein [Minicystis sp.]
MPIYLTNEASFDLDAAFTDLTLHDLEAPLEDGARVGLWLSREALPAEGTLRDAARARVAERRQRLDGYRVLAERDAEIGGADALELSAQFREGDAIVYERQAHFASGRVWYCLTSRAPVADRAACDAAIERVAATLLFRAES